MFRNNFLGSVGVWVLSVRRIGDGEEKMVAEILIFLLIFPTFSSNPLAPTNKLSLATWGSYYQYEHKGPGTYAFGYDIEDPVTGNVQFKQEERHPNGTVTGSYGYVDAEGKPNVVTYIADEKGYRAKLETEGERVKYFPDKSAFSENSFEKEQQTNDVSGENEHLSKVPLESELNAYRLSFPSKYDYIRTNPVSNVSK